MNVHKASTMISKNHALVVMEDLCIGIDHSTYIAVARDELAPQFVCMRSTETCKNTSKKSR